MRIGEVLNLRVRDIEDRKLTISNPKSGKQSEVLYIPQKIADRLKGYIQIKGLKPENRVFSIKYTAASEAVKRAGRLVGIEMRPHDLRRHAATFASRSGVPLEIVSKVILRHANLSTAQRYLGKVSNTEAIRWIELGYG
jgi:integrase